MTARRWSRRPSEVEAIRLDDGNADEVAEWACGRVDGDTVRLPKTTIPVRVGEYAVRDVLPDGLGDARCMRPFLFEYCYEPLSGEPRRHRRKDADGG